MTLNSDQFSADLQAARATLESLQVMLQRERDQIASRQADELPATAAEKTRLLQRLDEINPAERTGLRGDALESALQQAGDDLLDQWRQFLDAVSTVRRENERNGIAIQRSLGTVTEELRILHGGGRQNSDTYDAHGGAPAGPSTNLSTRA